jgi:hypothetical protein
MAWASEDDDEVWVRPRGRMSDLPTPRERDVLRAIDHLAGRFSRRGFYDQGGVRDVRARAVAVYLIRASLHWSYPRIGRRLGGLSRRHAIRLFPRGRRLVRAAVAAGEITPGLLLTLLPPPGP